MNPYSSLPDTRFWARSVARAQQVDPMEETYDWIGGSTRVATAGSCFAQRIGSYLNEHSYNVVDEEPAPAFMSAEAAQQFGYGIYSARYGNIYTPRQLLQLLWRARDTWQPREDFWLRPDGRAADAFRPTLNPGGYVSLAELQRDRDLHLAAVRRIVDGCDVLVFTLGLVETWASRLDGAVYPVAPGVAAGSYDPVLHALSVFSFGDIVADLDLLLDELRRHNPGIKVLLTVSPVPLTATAQDQHVLTATMEAKSILRAAAGEVCRNWGENVRYFPSFEIVTGLHTRGRHFEENLRSVTKEGVEDVMACFQQHFCVPLDDVNRRTGLSLQREAVRVAADASRELAEVLCDEVLLDVEQ